MIGFQKSQKEGNQTSPDHLDGLQKVGAKVEHGHHRRIGTLDTLDKIQKTILQEEEEDFHRALHAIKVDTSNIDIKNRIQVLVNFHSRFQLSLEHPDP